MKRANRRHRPNRKTPQKNTSSRVSAILEQANSALNNGDNEQARLGYLSVLNIDEFNADAMGSLGVLEAEASNFASADNWFLKASNAAPDNPFFPNARGLVLLELNKLSAAVECFNAALALDPDYVPAMAKLGRALTESNKPKQAIEWLQKALEINPGFTDARMDLASALANTGRSDEAKAALHAALQQNPNDVTTLKKSIKAFQSIGEMEESEKLARALLDIYPDSSFAITILSLTKKFTEYDDDLKNMERVFHKISIKGDLQPANYGAEEDSDDGLKTVAVSIAKAFEDTGEKDKAFNYYRIANKLRRSEFSYPGAEHYQHFTKRIEIFTPAFIQNCQGFGYLDTSPIFIIGMPRSGTTLLEQVLHAHPKVFGAGELNLIGQLTEEIYGPIDHFYRAVKDSKFNPDLLQDIGHEYVQRIRQIDSDTTFIVDKMPDNFLNVGIIRLALPNAKIIHNYRNPIDNAFSIYRQIFETGHHYAYDLVELGLYHNKYRELMAHWHKVFPGQIFDNSYEDMVADLEGQTRKVLDFCGLDWDPNCLNFHQAERAVRTASVTQVRQPVYKSSVEKWRKYETQLQPLVKVLNKGLPF